MRTEPLLACGAALAVLLVASSASAFCRTTTCDATGATNCAFDSNGCSTTGLPLFWPSKCLDFGVQQDGSPKLGISYDQANMAIQTAASQWMSVSCGTASPSFKFWDDGKIVCNEPQYNPNGPNANIWMFRDKDWPYVGANTTLALTTVTFAIKTGEILDADVELNSFGTHFVVTDSGPGTDLQSIATHESGHFLGLAHSNDITATMYPQYQSGDRSFRTLAQDDVDGICTVYPPDRNAPDCTGSSTPGGFSANCAGSGSSSSGSGTTASCHCSLGESRSASNGLWAALVAAVGLSLRRRRKH